MTLSDAHSVGSHVTAHATGMKQDDGSDECNIDGLPDGVTAKLIDIEDGNVILDI